MAGSVTEKFEHMVRAAGGTCTRTTAPQVPRLIAELAQGTPVIVACDLAELQDALARLGTRCTVAERARSDVDSLEARLLAAGISVTRGLAGIAASGTVVVGPSGGNGGLISCLIPRHCVLLEEEKVADSLAEVLSTLSTESVASGVEMVFITGPSRTADIEMMSVLGVHGPLELHVVLVSEEA